jgi:TetR/AcrR family transcriptional regulator, transcriptional repressor of bet genes
MPRQVDHQERREAIAEAIVRLVTTKGVEAASLRAVAAEAGVSMGAVQHYFTTRDEMLLFALEYGNRIFGARVQKLIAERRPATLRETFRLFFSLLLPLDDDGRSGARLWAALIARGCVDEPTAKLAAEAYTNLTAFVDRQVTEAANERETADGIDVARSARHLVSVIEGLRWPLLFGVYSERDALAVLDAQLDLIFGPAAGRPGAGTGRTDAPPGR